MVIALRGRWHHDMSPGAFLGGTITSMILIMILLAVLPMVVVGNMLNVEADPVTIGRTWDEARLNKQCSTTSIRCPARPMSYCRSALWSNYENTGGFVVDYDFDYRLFVGTLL